MYTWLNRFRNNFYTKELASELISQKKMSTQENRKLLMLSAGEASKSTIFKHILFQFTKDFNDNQKFYREVIWSNILYGMKALLKAQKDLLPLEPISSKNSAHAKSILDAEFMLAEPVFPEFAASVKTLWKEEPVLKKLILMKENFQCYENIVLFLDRGDVFEQNYVPTQQDVLLARVKTTGVLETEFTYQQKKFRVVDVGGQRNERKKCLIPLCFLRKNRSYFIINRDSLF